MANEATQHAELVRVGQLVSGYHVVYDGRTGKWRVDEINRMVLAICDTREEADEYVYESTHIDGSAVRSEGEGSAVDSDRSAQGTTHPGPPPPSARYDGEDAQHG